MGDSLTDQEEGEKLSSLSDFFKEKCPFFMAIGMSYQEYWYDDVWIASYYLKAWELKKEQKNEELWLQGVYIYEAMCDVAPVLHAFCKNGTKPLPYPSEPYSFHKKSKKEKEMEEKKEIQDTYNFFKNWGSAVSRKFKNKENKEKQNNE